MAPVSTTAAATADDYLTNPLATSTQLLKLRNAEDEHGRSVRFAQGQLISAAGVLLRLSQEVVAHAIVLLQRFLVSYTTRNILEDGGRREGEDYYKEFSPKTYSAAAIYLAAKISPTPVSPRSVVNVFAYLMCPTASPLRFVNPDGGKVGGEGKEKSEEHNNQNNGVVAAGPSEVTPVSPTEYYVSEGTYEREKRLLLACESIILVGIGYDTRVALPHVLALTYIQALLGASWSSSNGSLAQRVFEHLNAGLLSPQLLYLTHQPNALAVGAIYLAAREVGVKLVEQNWWEVFDVDREDLGFLVLAYGSVANFARAELEKWKTAPLALG